MARKLKAVLDTQVIVRGVAAVRPSSQVVRLFDLAIYDQRYHAVANGYIMGEVRKTLRKSKFAARIKYPDELIVQVMNTLHSKMTILPSVTHSSYPLTSKRVRDPITGQRMKAPPIDVRDSPVIEAALEGDVPYVVTMDKPLLSLEKVEIAGWNPIDIVRPEMFLQILLGS